MNIDLGFGNFIENSVRFEMYFLVRVNPYPLKFKWNMASSGELF